MNVIPDPPSSPDLVACDYFLFQNSGQCYRVGYDMTTIQGKSLDTFAKFQTTHFTDKIAGLTA